jgi:hypothetical protein
MRKTRPANVNGGIEGEAREGAFVDPTSESAAKSTLCTFAAAGSLASLPSRR